MFWHSHLIQSKITRYYDVILQYSAVLNILSLVSEPAKQTE